MHLSLLGPRDKDKNEFFKAYISKSVQHYLVFIICFKTASYHCRFLLLIVHVISDDTKRSVKLLFHNVSDRQINRDWILPSSKCGYLR